VDNPEALPERLKQRLLEPAFADQVKILGLVISFHAGTGNFAKVVAKYPDELLTAVLQETVRDGALLAKFFESEARALVIDRVLRSNDLFAWKDLARSCPELEDLIQQKILDFWEKEHKSLPALSTPYAGLGFLEDFLRDTKSTNPVPIQWCFVVKNDMTRLVDATIYLPHRTSLFATIAMIMVQGLHANYEPGAGRLLAKLCGKRPEALPIVQECLLELNPLTEVFISVSTHVPGIDLDLLEEHILTRWPKSHQQMFCDKVKRDSGPARNMLAVEYVMES